MRLAVFNGSPRGGKSNTRILLEHFLQGFGQTEGNSHELYYLNQVGNQERFKQAFCEADCVLLAFPLYTDAMPGLVKQFIETLAPICGRDKNPALGFIVQSGFPEATHSRPVERYNEKLALRLGCRYLGTIVKGGVEGIQVKPPGMTRKLYSAFYLLGEAFARTGAFEPQLVGRLAKPERLSPAARFLFSLLQLTGLTNFYWNWMLKENDAFKRRFARPYA